MSFNESACVHCGACGRVCKMNVDPVKNPNSAECIKCGECVKTCPKGALSFCISHGSATSSYGDGSFGR